MLKFVSPLFILLLSFTHVGSDRSKMALFDLKPLEGSNYHLKAVFNRNNLMQVLEIEEDNNNEASVTTSLQKYLNQHLTFQFDEEPVQIEWQNSRTGDQFISIEATLFTSVVSPRNIRITNSCLVEEVAQHANLIRIYLHNKKRIFKLDANRKSTLVQYREISSTE